MLSFKKQLLNLNSRFKNSSFGTLYLVGMSVRFKHEYVIPRYMVLGFQRNRFSLMWLREEHRTEFNENNVDMKITRIKNSCEGGVYILRHMLTVIALLPSVVMNRVGYKMPKSKGHCQSYNVVCGLKVFSFLQKRNFFSLCKFLFCLWDVGPSVIQYQSLK